MIDIYAPTSADGYSAEEAQLYDLIMAYRAENGLPSIGVSNALTITAGRHAVDTLYNIWQPGLTLPDGANLHSWSDAPYYGDQSNPEVMWNSPQRIGVTYSEPAFEISAAGYETVAEALEGWKTSPGHNSVILNQGTWANQTWNAIGIGVEHDPSVGGGLGGNIYHVWFGSAADAPPSTTTTTTASSQTIQASALSGGDPATLFVDLKDFDGNNLGAPEGWKSLGKGDVQGDGDDEFIYVNPTLGRWATLGPDSSDTIDFANHGNGGDTRVVGIYLDPLVEAGIVEKGSAIDSARRLENDLTNDNLVYLAGNDYDKDGFQQLYFKTADGTAFLHALMHADGNVRYANYQSEDQMKDYLVQNGFGAETYGDWLG